jgi:hypothetical protein
MGTGVYPLLEGVADEVGHSLQTIANQGWVKPYLYSHNNCMAQIGETVPFISVTLKQIYESNLKR